MTVLVTGGAGFIGSHVTRLLRGRGQDVVVVDDLSAGRAERLIGINFADIDLVHTDSVDLLSDLMRACDVDSVIHFAARKQVGESVKRPAWYAQQNIGGMANLMLAMENAGVVKLVYSSSAAVYGATEGEAIREGAPTHPINPYGTTKLVGEWLAADAASPTGLRSSSLRYFNVAGSGWDEFGDTAVLNLVPMVFERMDRGDPPLIFGDDYDTPDGTCIRDYVHVLDLAEAHLAVLDGLEARSPGSTVYNVGTGTGTSVRRVVDGIRALAGYELPARIEPRRKGDPAVVVADPSRIRNELGWYARYGIDDILQSAWSAHLFHQRLIASR